MKRALITGITGQDGSYLAELLLAKGYEVHGLKRRGSSHNTQRIDHLLDRITLHYGDVTDLSSLIEVMLDAENADTFDEIYNLAAQSHVRVSMDMPLYTLDAAGRGAVNVFEAARIVSANSRIYQASSSEMFGDAAAPQNEDTPMRPTSPYGCAKLYAHQMAQFYRQGHGLFIACGILFNHESPRRGETFVTKKICRALARGEELRLGSLTPMRDWGYAPEYVEAMWQMLQLPIAGDLVIGTGEMHSVDQWLCEAVRYGPKEGEYKYRYDDRFHRGRVEVSHLQADCSRARAVIGWEPKVKFTELVRIMMEHELKEAGCGR